MNPKHVPVATVLTALWNRLVHLSDPSITMEILEKLPEFLKHFDLFEKELLMFGSVYEIRCN